MDKDIVTGHHDEMANKLLNSAHTTRTDLFTRLATVERAKAIRLEAQKARKSKPPTTSEGHGGWIQPG